MSYLARVKQIRPTKHQERGAVMLMTTSFMLLGVMCLALVVDTGRLYVIKRTLQRQADVAALEVAARGGRCADGSAQQIAQENLARNGFTLDAEHQLALPECGDIIVNNHMRQLDTASSSNKAIAISLSQTTPASMIAGGAFGESITISARAVASVNGSPLAMLTLRSTLLNVNITKNSKAKLLSDVFGGLLGGNLNISVGAWNGLIHTDIDIFEFMDRLAVNIGVSAGEYDNLLSTEVSTGELIQAAIDVLEQQNGTPQVTLNALEAIVALDQILLASSVSSSQLKLGEVVSLAADADYDGAKARVQLYQFIQGIILLANQHNAVSAVIPIDLLGNTVDLAIKVIEPPQFAAIGDPAAAKDEAYLAVNNSPNRIYVRSAQLRMVFSVSLSNELTSLVSGLSTAVSNLASPLVSVINGLLGLNLGVLLGGQDQLSILLLPAPFRFDINLDLAGGDARVTDFSCQGNEKSLTVPVKTAAATLRIGKMGTSANDAKEQVMSAQSEPTVLPIPLVDFGIKHCSILFGCGARVPFAAGGLGLKVKSSVFGAEGTLLFESPAEENLPDLGNMAETRGSQVYQSISSASLIESLRDTLSGPEITAYEANGNTLGSVLMLVGSVTNTVVALLKTAISTVLSPLLDPLLTFLIENLGLDLAKTEVAANLSCHANQGVSMVM